MPDLRRYFSTATPSPPASDSTTEWRGSLSGNFQTAGNWTNGVPTSGDLVYFNSGSVDVDAGLSNASVSPKALYIDAYNGHLGTTASPLVLGIIPDLIIRQRSGSVHLEGFFFNVHILETSGSDEAVTLSAPSTNYINRLWLSGSHGKVKITDSSRVRRIYVSSASRDQRRSITRSQLVIGSSVTDAGGVNPIEEITVLEGGHVTSDSGFETARVSGELTLQGTATLGTCDVRDGGYVRDDSSGTVTQLNVRQGGHYSLTLSEAGTKTLTDIRMDPESELVVATGQKTAIVTNGITYYGGKVYPDGGTAVAVT